jgi:hypothetical protein
MRRLFSCSASGEQIGDLLLGQGSFLQRRTYFAFARRTMARRTFCFVEGSSILRPGQARRQGECCHYHQRTLHERESPLLIFGMTGAETSLQLFPANCAATAHVRTEAVLHNEVIVKRRPAIRWWGPSQSARAGVT